MSDIRDRIAAVLLGPAGLDGSGYPPGTLGHYRRIDEAHRLADVLIRELGLLSPPDRTFVDDQGRTWEWCGGQPGTWAWRVTNLGDRQRRRITGEFLSQVAQVYRDAAMDHAPTAAVAHAFGVKQWRAANYVKQARERGFLPPTTQGVAKA